MTRKVLLYAALSFLAIIFIILIGINLGSPLGGSSNNVGAKNERNTSAATTTGASTVTMDEPEAPLKIYMTTNGGGIQVYSEATNDRWTLVESTEEFSGVAYDSDNSLLYFSSRHKIYRVYARENVIQSPALVYTHTADERAKIFGLAWDWITGNLYAVGSRSLMVVCATKAGDQGPSLKLKCKKIIGEGEYGSRNGIALDPIHGTMYMTTHEPSTILKMTMNATKTVQIVRGLEFPRGIAIDYSSSRLFWADQNTNKVQSSNLDGSDVETVKIFPMGTQPYGITLTGENIYVGNQHSFRVMSKHDYSMRTVWNTYWSCEHLASTSVANRPRTRRNDCEGQSCSGVCVLIEASFGCRN